MNHVTGYLQRARLRAQRRKSPWNLVLIPFALVGFTMSWWLLSRPIFWVRSWGIPEDTFLGGGTRVGLILFYVGLMFVAIGPGLLLSNICAWLISPMRSALEGEAAAHPGTDFKSGTQGLLKFSLLIFAIFYPIAWIGGLNAYGISSEGIFYRNWFSTQVIRFEWQDVREVRTQCFSKRGAGEGEFSLVFKDGTGIDLFSAGPKKFFPVYPLVANALKGVQFEFYHGPPPRLFSGHPCPGSWEKYFARKPGI